VIIICGLYGQALADQMTMYRISQNIVASATIDGLPFVLLFCLTVCVYNTRWYEVNNKPRDFKTQMDPYPWKKGN
jgi:flagellar biosynthesis component FlhA